MIRVLLVDDDNDFCFIIKNELENIIGDYHVITAQNGKEGLKKWREYNPDVIVSDIKMPLLNGLDMIKSIRQVDTEIPILIITGLAQEQKVEEGYIHGANIFIRKSFDIYDLDGHIKGIYKSSFFWSHKTKKELYNIGDYTLFTRSGIILNNVSNKSANLTETENEILCMLVEDMEHIVSKNCITNFLGKELGTKPNSLYTHISSIRKILSEDTRITIKAMNNVGYRLTVNNMVINKK